MSEDLFVWVEGGLMEMGVLTDRGVKGWIRVQHPALLNQEAAAELATTFRRIVQKYSQPAEPTGVLSPANEPRRAPRPQPQNGRPSSDQIEDWLLATGPQTRQALREHFNMDAMTVGSRIGYLRNSGRIVEQADGTFRALGEEEEPEEPEAPAARRVTADEVLAYVTTHPGLVKADLRERLNAEPVRLKRALDALRKRKAIHVEATDGGWHPGDGPLLTPGERRELSLKARQAANPDQVWEAVS